MSPQKIILIAGPTASGKSALAMEIARRENGVIINADAMQVYSGLPILTAQPSPDEQKEIPHELYAVLDPAEPSSAGKWHTLALAAIQKTLAVGRTPVVVGGTGLYFRTLFGGLADIPAVPDTIRAQTQMLYDKTGEESFRRELAKRDPESAARIARNDRQRLIRAYEVVEHTGQSLTEWQKEGAEVGGQGSGKIIFLTPDPRTLIPDPHLLMPLRDRLYAACNARFLKMIERGAIEEVRQFMQRNLDPELPAMKTLGLRELAAHLRGELTLAETIAAAQQATRNYAKRQMTWFRNQWPRLM